jgi:hypothetical protein
VTHELLNLLKIKKFPAMPALLAALIGVPAGSIAAPGDILFSDDFNRVSLPPWTTSNPNVIVVTQWKSTANCRKSAPPSSRS